MPIGGKKKVELTMESILERVTDLQIYEKYMPHRNWELNEVCISPFPKADGSTENNPSFLIGNKKGYVSHILFSNNEYRGDCFAFVKQLYSLSTLDDVLRMIDRDFKLGIADGKSVEGKINVTNMEKKVTKRNTLIQVTVRPLNHDELAYWKQYHLEKEDLKDIYGIKKLYLNKKLFSFPDNQLKFGYFYPEGGWWKIYRPYANKKEKWAPNNVPIHAMDYKENIKNCDLAFINKSRKDTLVIKKIFPCSVGVQNESTGCFTPENVQYIKSNSKRQVLSFDSDETGVENSKKITVMYGFDYCNVPRKYLSEGIKDWSDLAKVHGLQEIEKIFKLKGII